MKMMKHDTEKSDMAVSSGIEVADDVTTANTMGLEAGVEAETEQLREELAAATRTASENQELYLRERAELENFKRRSMRDRSEALRYAAEPLARDVVALVDNLERAVDHARNSGDDGPVTAGVELVLKAAIETLQRHGVVRIEAIGQAFDPAIHEAIAQISSDAPVNQVVEQFLPGYRMHDRLLRAAQVAVSAPSSSKESDGSE